MSRFSSRDVMVAVLPEGAVGEISWDGIQACTTGGCSTGTSKGTCTNCTACTNKTNNTKKSKASTRELALLKAQLRSIR